MINLEEIGKKLAAIKGMLITGGAIIGTLFAGYIWLQDRIVENRAEAISQAVVQKGTNAIAAAVIIKADSALNPLNRTEYLEYRRQDSIERHHAELIALDFMTRQDSIGLVVRDQSAAIDLLKKQLNRMEAKIDADAQGSRDEQLAEIWKYLKKKDEADSSRAIREAELEELERKNKDRLQKIKTGDRIK
jgi:hypothetical protein